MSNQFIDIEAFAHLSGLSVNTVRRKIKTLSETDKNAYIHYIPVVGRGGQKIMLDKALVTQWTAMSNQKTAQNPVDESMSNQEKETIQEQTKTPEQLPNDSTVIIELLKKQIEDKDKEIEYLKKESDFKNNQIAYFVNEVSHLKTTLQLSSPKDETQPLKWWQFWK